jgi:hypothetical protein
MKRTSGILQQNKPKTSKSQLQIVGVRCVSAVLEGRKGQRRGYESNAKFRMSAPWNKRRIEMEDAGGQ